MITKSGLHVLLTEALKRKKAIKRWPKHVVSQAGFVFQNAGKLMFAAQTNKYEQRTPQQKHEDGILMRDLALQTIATCLKFLEQQKIAAEPLTTTEGLQAYIDKFNTDGTLATGSITQEELNGVLDTPDVYDGPLVRDSDFLDNGMFNQIFESRDGLETIQPVVDFKPADESAYDGNKVKRFFVEDEFGPAGTAHFFVPKNEHITITHGNNADGPISEPGDEQDQVSDLSPEASESVHPVR